MKAKNKRSFKPGPVGLVAAEWIGFCELFTRLGYALFSTVLTLLNASGNPLSSPRGEILLEPNTATCMYLISVIFPWVVHLPQLDDY